MRGLWHALVVVAIACAVASATSGCSSHSKRSPKAACDALRHLGAVQAGMTPRHQVALNRAHLQESYRRQRDAELEVEAAAPTNVAKQYARVLRIDGAIRDAVLAAWGPGDGRSLEAEADAAGYSAIAPFVVREGVQVGGHRTTWAEYTALRDATYRDLTASCPELRGEQAP